MVDYTEKLGKNPREGCPYQDVCTYEDYGSGEICSSQDYGLCVWFETMKEIYTERNKE